MGDVHTGHVRRPGTCAQLRWDTKIRRCKRSIPLMECFVSGNLLGFPNQVHFNTKLLHSVDHLSYYVCLATLGHNNIKV